jgi:hypothetical protein
MTMHGRPYPQPAAMGLGLPPARALVEGLEVTQVIQSLSHDAPLVAGKTTLLRTYLGVESATALDVRGELEVLLPGGSMQTVTSVNVVRLDAAMNGQVQWKREDLGRSLNFLLPVGVTVVGQATFRLQRVQDVRTGAALQIGGLVGGVAVPFVATPPLRVRILGMRYSVNGQAIEPSTLDFDLIESWLRRAFPVADVVFSRTVIDANPTWPFNADQINAQVAAIRRLDMNNGGDQRTHYYGLVADGGGVNFMRGKAAGIPAAPDPTTVASGPTGSGSFGWDFDGCFGDWYTGHELAHTFGRRHPGFCGQTSDDAQFPYPNGQISPNDGRFVGWDSGDSANGIQSASLPGTVWHDVMTYCDSQWMSAYTYAGIHQRLIAEDAMGPGGDGGGGIGAGGGDGGMQPAAVRIETGRFINVVANVNLTTRQGKILYVHPLDKTQVPAAGPPLSSVALQLRKADGTLLEKIPVELKLSSCPQPGEDRSGLVDAVLSLRPDVSFVDLLLDQVVLDTFSGDSAPAQLGNLQRRDRGNLIEMSWDAPPTVVGPVTYSMQVSQDDGRTWETVAVGRNTPKIDLSRDQYRGVSRLQVRVIATGGFTSRMVSQTEVTLGGPSN